MNSDYEADLDLPMLPSSARLVRIVPDLQNHSLLSIGRLCDAGCEVHFTQHLAEVTYGGQTVLMGHRTEPRGLWSFDVPDTNSVEEANAIDTPSVRMLVEFSHGALFSPTNATLEKALQKGYIHGLPGLNVKTLRRFKPNSKATAKGHLDQVRQNLQLTKPKKCDPTATDQDTFPELDSPNKQTFYCYATVEEMTGQIYTDQTGRFPVPSKLGNNYVMVLYDYDSNAILAQPCKTRKGPCLLDAYKKLLGRLKKAGLTPRLQRLDNECSTALKEYMYDENIDFQLAPPGIHQRNSAKRAI